MFWKYKKNYLSFTKACRLFFFAVGLHPSCLRFELDWSPVAEWIDWSWKRHTCVFNVVQLILHVRTNAKSARDDNISKWAFVVISGEMYHSRYCRPAWVHHTYLVITFQYFYHKHKPVFRNTNCRFLATTL